MSCLKKAGEGPTHGGDSPLVHGVDGAVDQDQEAVGLVDLEAAMGAHEVASRTVVAAEEGEGAFVAEPLGGTVDGEARVTESLTAPVGLDAAGQAGGVNG